jgi:hypothetical protein
VGLYFTRFEYRFSRMDKKIEGRWLKEKGETRDAYEERKSR